MPPSRRAALEPLTPSPALADLLGSSELTNREATVKAVSAYISAHNLQHPRRKKQIFLDEKLRGLLEHANVAPKPAAASIPSFIEMATLVEVLEGNLSPPDSV